MCNCQKNARLQQIGKYAAHIEYALTESLAISRLYDKIYICLDNAAIKDLEESGYEVIRYDRKDKDDIRRMKDILTEWFTNPDVPLPFINIIFYKPEQGQEKDRLVILTAVPR